MKNLKLILLVLLYTSISDVGAQQVLTLGTCYKDALSSHPLAQEKQIHHQLWQLKDDNLASSWYPTIDAGAKILYNSNITDLSEAFSSVPIPGIGDNISSMPHDQYKLTVDISQIIYDGGTIKSIRQIESAGLRLSEQEVEVQLYKLREQINNSYFSFILLKKQKELLESYLEIIQEKILSLESAIKNGVLLPSDRDLLRAEKIKLQQQISETEIRISSAAWILTDLCGKEIGISTEAIIPEPSIDPDTALLRPELRVFDLKADQLEANRELIKSSRKPKAFAFANLGYGKPAGNDFFSDSFGPYYIVGAGIKWNIIDWKKSSRNEQMIELNKTIINSRKEELEDNLLRALEIKYAEIKTLESSLQSDEEIIIIRKSIRETAASRFSNGTITARDYLSELNSEKQSILMREIHRISLAKSKIEYLNIAGKEIE